MNSSLSAANLAEASCDGAGMVEIGAATSVKIVAAAVKSLTRVSISASLKWRCGLYDGVALRRTHLSSADYDGRRKGIGISFLRRAYLRRRARACSAHGPVGAKRR